MLYYKESKDGQLLEEGITEAGALSSWVAAATSYSVHGFAMLPVYIFYSMFGFQRVGDLIWAAADQRARGFLIGATAGRTTLAGEGLQHQDGSSHLLAATVPNCRAYDPAFAYEMAVIFDHGVHSMMEEGNDEFYYITAMNENYDQPSIPENAEAGCLTFKTKSGGSRIKERILPRLSLIWKQEMPSIPDEEFASRLSVYEKAIKNFPRDSLKLSGAATQCWSEQELSLRHVPCFINGRMAQNGFPIACENDCYSLIAELLGQYASDATVGILDINHSIPKELTSANSARPVAHQHPQPGVWSQWPSGQRIELPRSLYYQQTLEATRFPQTTTRLT